MKTKDILIEIIDHLSLYEDDCTQMGVEPNTSDFIGFLTTHIQSRNVKIDRFNNGTTYDWQSEQSNGPMTDISILIVLLFRYAKGYMKKALKDSQIKTPDEFSFLMSLMLHTEMSKTALIHDQITEKTSGTEIINRMIKQGLVTQTDDLVDKRSVRIRITETGRNQILAVLPQMRMVSQIVSGNLTEPQKNMLAYLLRKLEVFHNIVFLQSRPAGLAEILAQYSLHPNE